MTWEFVLLPEVDNKARVRTSLLKGKQLLLFITRIVLLFSVEAFSLWRNLNLTCQRQIAKGNKWVSASGCFLCGNYVWKVEIVICTISFLKKNRLRENNPRLDRFGKQISSPGTTICNSEFSIGQLDHISINWQVKFRSNIFFFCKFSSVNATCLNWSTICRDDSKIWVHWKLLWNLNNKFSALILIFVPVGDIVSIVSICTYLYLMFVRTGPSFRTNKASRRHCKEEFIKFLGSTLSRTDLE